MATLRDIRNLYGPERTCFYAGFGNRLTDQISYRTVDVPRNRIFTINTNSEVSLDLLSLNKLKMSYVNINEVVDHYFPPVSTLVTGGGEEYTDFKYWRDDPLAMADFSASESDEDEDEEDEENDEDGPVSVYDDEEEDQDEEVDDALADSYISRASMDEFVEAESVLSGSADEERMIASMRQELEDAYHDKVGDALEYQEAHDGVTKSENEQQIAEFDDSARPSGALARRKSVIVEDLSAERITGVSRLSVEKQRHA